MLLKNKLKKRNEEYRIKVKELKTLENINYKSFSDSLGFNYSTFYSWLRGSFCYSNDNLNKIESLFILIEQEKLTNE